ncbi:MAG TPA: 2-oxoglutarate ferredoxin oxidoreductase subunit beta, partial [Firmicutes bacterium]|nr:2-oxoglutarate ferredoxin oxidoreductase subunit beta [Bacillota bacterium]
LIDLIKSGLEHKGFSFIEVVSQCPMYYGRKNKLPSAVAMLEWQKEHAVPVQAAAKLSPEQLAGRFVIGELYHEDAPEYGEVYAQVVARARGEA